MFLKSISLVNYRNYLDQQLTLSPGVNLFVGDNGQGKTNLLEAIYYLAQGSNFRGNKDIELIRWQQLYFRIVGQLIRENSQRLWELEVYYDMQKRKQVKVNGVKSKSVTELWGNLQVVLFAPDDLKIVKEGPAERRRYLDLEMCQMNPRYYQLLHDYQRVLHQRSNALKACYYGQGDQKQLAVWNHYLITYGSQMIFQRLQFLKQLVPIARQIQQELTEHGEKFTVTYHCSLGAIGDFSLEQIMGLFTEIVEKKNKEEIGRGLNLWGPHRDDLVFYLNGNDLKRFGSQGQQRTAILSLKMAELEIFFRKTKEYPLLLLDDVMSELDDRRRSYLIEMVNKNKIQTIITGANIDLASNNMPKQEIFFVEEGKIIRR